MMKRPAAFRFAAAVIFLLVAAPAFARDFWPIPDVAWKRPFGDHPPGAGAKIGQSRTKRGIPVGGVGAGNFMYNLAGTFGPWEFQIGKHEEKFLSQGAFHFYEKVGDDEPVVRTLATDDVLSGWDKLEKGLPEGGTPTATTGPAQYAALYPKAWVTYDYPFFATDLSLKHFSPILRSTPDDPANDRESSLPVGVFLFRVHNPSATEDATVSVMLTFPNQNLSNNSTRRGLWSTGKASSNGRTAEVVLGASDPLNDPDTEGSEWAIAARAPAQGTASYVRSWSGTNAQAAPLIDAWKNGGGVLPNDDLAADASASAGAVAVTITLKPGQRRIIPFALAWDFPIVQFGGQGSFDSYSIGGGSNSGPSFQFPFGGAKISNQRWWKRYTEWFPGGGKAGAIAAEALAERGAWERGINQWVRPVVNGPYPDWLKTAALNELYYNTFGGVFWANGLKDGVVGPAMLTFLQDGGKPYFDMECQAYPFAETFDVRHYESNHFNDLRPALERAVLRLWARFMQFDPQGHAPHDAGIVQAAPFLLFPGHPTSTIWTDLDSKFILQSYQHYLATRDADPTGAAAFLNEVWDSMVLGYTHLRTKRARPDNCLPQNVGPDTTYDTFALHGTSSLTAGLWVAALEAMLKTAEVTVEPEDVAAGLLLDDVRRCLALARPAIETELWNETGGYYQIDTLSPGYADGIMADATAGQYNAETLALPDVFADPAKRKSHLLAAYDRLFERWRNPPDTGQAVGAANGMRADGELVGTMQSDEVWTGVSYLLAATMYREGVRRERDALDDAGLKAKALDIAHAIYFHTYENEETAYWFGTPEGWRADDPTSFRAHQYQRPRAVWELLRAIKPPY